MPSWNHLPPEIKQHVVKKLDFMGRLAMKSVSHSDRCVVESVVFHLPRVRFGYKEERCLIVIYQGIGKFLRLEFGFVKEQCKRVILYKSENTFNSEKTSWKVIDSTNLLESGLSILKTLLAHPSISINVLEWDCSQEVPFITFFADTKLHVREIAFTNKGGLQRLLVNKICVAEDVKTLRSFGYMLSDENLVPTWVSEEYEMNDGRHEYVTVYQTEDFSLRIMVWMVESMLNLNHPTEDSRKRMRTIKVLKKSEESWNDDSDLGNENHEVFINNTSCGIRIDGMLRRDVEQFDSVKHLKCGLGNNCGKCGDPFEYWYYQNLPRRVFYESFWSDWIYREKRDSQYNACKQYHADEKKSMKTSSEKIQKEIASWGFKPMEESEDVEDVTETDSDSETEEDSDSETETDSDSETEEDSDSDTKTDSDSETEKFSHFDKEAILNLDAEADSDDDLNALLDMNGGEDSEDVEESEVVQVDSEDVEESEDVHVNIELGKSTRFHHAVLSKFTIIASIFFVIISYLAFYYFH